MKYILIALTIASGVQAMDWSQPLQHFSEGVGTGLLIPAVCGTATGVLGLPFSTKTIVASACAGALVSSVFPLVAGVRDIAFAMDLNEDLPEAPIAHTTPLPQAFVDFLAVEHAPRGIGLIVGSGIVATAAGYVLKKTLKDN